MKDEDLPDKLTAKQLKDLIAKGAIKATKRGLALVSPKKGKGSPKKSGGGRGHEGRGFRTIGGRRIYFRSKAEANTARVLEYWRANGEIESWDYEPRKFEFPGIKGKNYCYTPDFLVTRPDFSTYWIEVKGWLDNDSKIKIKRFAKFFPEEVLEYWDQKKTDSLKSYKPIIKSIE